MTENSLTRGKKGVRESASRSEGSETGCGLRFLQNRGLEAELGGGASALVGQDDRLDGHPAHGTQLVPLLELASAQVAGDHVARSAVHDAAVLGPRLADETRVEARLGQPPLGRLAALQVGDGRDQGRGRGFWRKQLLRLQGGGAGLRL